jgi:hypothetical protein
MAGRKERQERRAKVMNEEATHNRQHQDDERKSQFL